MPSAPNPSPPAPFDALAASYDADFTASPLARALRQRAHARLLALVPPGSAALDLGCGTGEDARALAGRGVHVTAADSSPVMRECATRKLSAFPAASVHALDLNALPASALPGPYALAYANFGVLNCVHDLRDMATWLAARVLPGGYLAFAVMGPFCLWETLWHGLHGAHGIARRRWRGQAHFRTPTGQIELRYPAPRALTAAFAPAFRRTSLRPFGVFIPPSDVFPALARRPRLARMLTALDARTAGLQPLAALADHYWIELERV
jgi:SAM-dependent methyltransferase